MVWSELVKGTNEVTVRLGSVRSGVAVYDPTRGTGAVQSLGKMDMVRLSLTDHPVVIEMR